ncbi:hypothetical protein BVC80_8411g14 [Macleaya cordata]|uniref:Uncharacterized protein n=1 Tax=Macleaya cordata TaxID=56857 RepID=A0A200QYD3_MACCD|nr:hypothetical protein BVC80_8411g14 [Macleaya cordata]
MHVMGPFLGQGRSAVLEDAVVLARNLAQELCTTGSKRIGQQVMQARIGAAMDRYVKERKMRLLMLSTQTYLTGMLLEASSKLTKLTANSTIDFGSGHRQPAQEEMQIAREDS